MLILAPLLALAALVTAQNIPSFNISYPIVQCQATQISWSTSRPPMSIRIYPSAHSDLTLADLSNQSGTSVTWITNVQAGTQISFKFTDSGGGTSTSVSFTVQPGSSSDCLGADTGATQTGSPVGTGDSTASLNAASSDIKVGFSSLLGLAAVAAMV